MKQPALGLVASAIVIVIALGYISLFAFGTFVGWVSFFMLGLIPMQVVAVVLWGGNPGFVKSLGQPAKGLVLVLVTVVVAAVTTPVAFAVVGESVSPPGPIPSHFAVVVVPTTFWLAIMMGGWPFTSLIKNPIAAGLAVVVAAYVLTYVEFRVFFNYDFMQGAPVYLASAPHGHVQRRHGAGVSRHGAGGDVPGPVLRSVAADLVAGDHEAAGARAWCGASSRSAARRWRCGWASACSAWTRWRF